MRSLFLEPVVTALQRRGRTFKDADVGSVAKAALQGLVQPDV
ncbi:MAG: hypothetical protein ACM3IH_22510 [Sphingobacteriales bacterium]|jgi:hypothetical protein